MKKKNQTNNIKKSRKKECILADYSQAKPFERKRELIVQTPNVKIHWPSATKKKQRHSTVKIISFLYKSINDNYGIHQSKHHHFAYKRTHIRITYIHAYIYK